MTFSSSPLQRCAGIDGSGGQGRSPFNCGEKVGESAMARVRIDNKLPRYVGFSQEGTSESSKELQNLLCNSLNSGFMDLSVFAGAGGGQDKERCVVP